MARARSKCLDALDRGVLPGVPNDSYPGSSSPAPVSLVRSLAISRWSRAGSAPTSPVPADDVPPDMGVKIVAPAGV
jgi:hypothetical protein